MSEQLRILHLEDDLRDAALIRYTLEEDGLDCRLVHVKSRQEFEAALATGTFDAILSDYSLPQYNGFAAIGFARARNPNIPFILLSGTLGEEQAVDSLRNGATDYVLKQRLTRLVPAIRRAVAEAQDRVKHKRAEEQIREQAALLDKAQDAILVCDLENRIQYWNKGAERLYGWTPMEAIGQNAEELLCKDIDSLWRTAREQTIERGEWLGELNRASKDGRRVIVESRWTLLRDGDAKPKCCLVLETDITEKKELETQFLRAQRMESIGALAGGIAHDLNNVLAPILMVADLLHDQLDTAEGKHMLQMVKTSAQRGSGMVKQILSFARGASGEQTHLQVGHLATDMVKLAKDTFPRSIMIESRIRKELPPVKGDATQLHQVLLNLCVNARDAMPKGGSLSIAVERALLKCKTTPMLPEPVSGEHVLMTVTDTGHGIPSELLDRVFEPFFTTKELGKGTGLGLSTVLAIIKTHNGFVEVSSRVDQGTTFHVYLPAAEATSEPSVDSASIQAPMGNGEQILLVDDEAAVLEITRETLGLFNYRVLTAKDGSEALAVYAQHKGQINAVVTDMMMPVMDGPATVRALQQIDPKVKVIGVSGLGSRPGLGDLNELTVQALLKKPFSSEKLLTTLRQVLECVGSPGASATHMNRETRGL